MSTAAPAPAEIVLVRHGRSAHVARGWLDVDDLRRWIVAYDAAEIVPHHRPPPELVELARTAGVVVTSDLPRALASAALIAPGREVHASALLREAPLETDELPLPRLAGLRLPLWVWALVFGLRWLRASRRGEPPPGVDAAALARAEEAAAWLAGLAGGSGGVVVVTHATFRTLVAAALQRRGWRGPERRPFREWTAWRLRRG
jgi:broad specificity phosphatase PhoE